MHGVRSRVEVRAEPSLPSSVRRSGALIRLRRPPHNQAAERGEGGEDAASLDEEMGIGVLGVDLGISAGWGTNYLARSDVRWIRSAPIFGYSAHGC
jgi:hypothetical protein